MSFNKSIVIKMHFREFETYLIPICVLSVLKETVNTNLLNVATTQPRSDFSGKVMDSTFTDPAIGGGPTALRNELRNAGAPQLLLTLIV